MAAYFNNSADRLYVTLTTGVDRTKHFLACAQVQHESAQGGHGSAVSIVDTLASTFPSNLRKNATPVVVAFGNTTRAGTTTLTDDVWEPVAAWFEPDDANRAAAVYYNGSSDSANSTVGDYSSNVANYDSVSIGLPHTGGNNYNRFRGWIAEVSIWECDSQATAASVASEVATKKATSVSVSGATCRAYWPLISDANADTYGDNLTNSGSVTFDAEDPGLSGGGGGGGSTAQVIGFSVI